MQFSSDKVPLICSRDADSRVQYPEKNGYVHGTNRNIHDRWDLTLRCIKDFYDGKDSAIGWCIEQDRDFFRLFGSFEGYVDFFLLNDCENPITL